MRTAGVSIVDDALNEGTESFVFAVSGATSGAAVSRPAATVNVTDNDATGLAVLAVTRAESDGATDALVTEPC